MTDIHDIVPPSIEPGKAPNGVVIRIYRWRDGLLLRERCLSVREHLFNRDTDPSLEMLAEVDREDTWTVAASGGGHRAVIIIGYDGDYGDAMSPPVLVTDDPALTGW